MRISSKNYKWKWIHIDNHEFIQCKPFWKTLQQIAYEKQVKFKECTEWYYNIKQLISNSDNLFLVCESKINKL